jgi:hypothetical protein
VGDAWAEPARKSALLIEGGARADGGRDALSATTSRGVRALPADDRAASWRAKAWRGVGAPAGGRVIGAPGETVGRRLRYPSGAPAE